MACYTLAASLLLAFSGAHAQVKPEKRKSIYLQINGPQESAARLRSVFAEEAARNHLFIADEPQKAASQVNITITDEHNTDHPLYAELLNASLVLAEGKPSNVAFCQGVTDGAGLTVTSSYTLPPEEALPAHSTVWIEGESGPQAPAEMLKKKIREAGIQIAASSGAADLTLKEVRLIRVPIPGRAMEAKMQSVLKGADGSISTLSMNVKGYLPVAEPISAEAEVCRSTIRHVSEPALSAYGQLASLDVALIAGRIKK